MTFSFHPEAEQEFCEAIEYYEKRVPGLGYDFALEIHAAIQRACEFPQAWSRFTGDVRRSMVHRFPYSVLYVEEQGGIIVLAIMNLHRAPGYWKNRIDGL